VRECQQGLKRGMKKVPDFISGLSTVFEMMMQKGKGTTQSILVLPYNRHFLG